MWTDKQKEAIDKRESNILVAASAGSGKTAVLVERVISRVIQDKIDINKLLIVTFTNASAAELKERLLQRIYKALDSDVSNAFLRRQIKNLNIANIETIHSFCLKLIRSNFNVLNLDPNIKICDDSRARVLKLKAINEVLEELYLKANKTEEDKSKLYKLLEIFSSKDDNLIEYVFKIYSYINSFSYPFEFLKESIEKYNIEDTSIDLVKTDFGKNIFNDAIDTISLLIQKEEALATELRKQDDFEKQIDVLNEDISYMKSIVNEAKTWDKLYLFISNFSFLRMPPYKGKNVELKDKITDFRNKILKKEVEALKERIYENSLNILKDNKIAYEYISYIYDIIYSFHEKYNNLKNQSDLIDFSDIEHLALKMLVKKEENGSYELTDIAKNKKAEFEEIYTDEYQDTSLVQEAILSAIAKDNNRFMVGDVKQSIYKFRQAMPEIFNEKYRKYKLNGSESKEKDVKILLSKNFRSRKNVVESINYIFEKIMSYNMGNCDYSDIEKLEFGATLYKDNNDLNYNTEINIIDLKSDDDFEEKEDECSDYISELKNFEIEALMVANKIKDVMENFKVYDVKKEQFRKTQYKDIVILLRSIKDKGKILEDTLKKEGIPSFCDANSSLFESDEIKLVLSVLRILDNPFQDIYMVSVMYSIIGKFSLDELLNIKSMSNGENIYNSLYIARDMLNEKSKENILSEDNKILLNKLNLFISFLERYISYSKIYTISELLIKLYKETNIYNQYMLEKDTSKLKLANLDYLIDVATNFESSFEDSNISSYITYIDNLKDKVDSSSSTAKTLGKNEDVVRIMTIHKSKGLEFPVVILCDTSRKYNIMDTSATIVLDNELGVGINVVKEELNISYPSVIKQAIKSKITKETKSEELRMLYVALTRAKEKLIIFSTIKDYDKFLSNQNAVYNADGKIDYKIVEKNNNYFSNIMIALEDKEKASKLFDITVHDKNSINASISEKYLKAEENLNIENKISNLASSVTCIYPSELFNKIKSNLDFEYQYMDDTKIENRVSVSKLKNKEKTVIQFEKPECLVENKNKKTGAKKGTIIHTILQRLEYKSINSLENLNEDILKLHNMKYINKEDVSKKDILDIYKFLESDIGQELKMSLDIHREEEFILKDTTISKSQIQGIIDLYYINNKGNIILIDFKTDNLNNEDEFVSRYKIQLDIYKKALEKLKNTKVENVYIYSFKLGKKIKI